MTIKLFSLFPLAPSDLKDCNFLLGCILFVLNRLLRIAAFTALIMGVIDLSYTLEVLRFISVYLNILCSVRLEILCRVVVYFNEDVTNADISSLLQ